MLSDRIVHEFQALDDYTGAAYHQSFGGCTAMLQDAVLDSDQVYGSSDAAIILKVLKIAHQKQEYAHNHVTNTML